MGQPARIERLVEGGVVLWRKRHADQGRRFRTWCLNLAARGLGIAALAAPAPLRAAEACATEARMIERLRGQGARVPEILMRGPRELLLSDLGPTLAMACRAAREPSERAALVEAGFAALAALHANGGCASQAFARNMTWQDGAVGFIDLEQDPLTAMPLQAAQARDVVLFVYSTVRFLRDDLPAYRRLLRAHLAAEPEGVALLVSQCARRLAWLQPLLRALGRHGQPVTLPLRKLANGTTPYAPVQTP